LDGSPSVPSVTTIKVTNGSLTDNGDGTVSVATSGASNVTIGSSAITGGTVGGVLYTATGPVLQQLTGAGLVLANTLSAPTIYAGATCTNQVLRVLSAAGAGTCVTLTSAYVDSSIGLTGSALSQFAATTSAQLAGVLSDESGSSGGFVRATGAALAPATLNIPNSITLPATCTTGDLYMDTDATSGQRIYACQSANTWALQGDGGGGGGTPSAVAPQVTTVNAGNTPYTALTTDWSIRCDTSAGARTINLPAATNKLMLVIKNLGSNACTVARAGADTIDGATSLVTSLANQGFILVSDGASAWDIQ
jgi:hypothetical protein